MTTWAEVAASPLLQWCAEHGAERAWCQHEHDQDAADTVARLEETR
jgi:hypothetical protein